MGSIAWGILAAACLLAELHREQPGWKKRNLFACLVFTVSIVMMFVKG